MDQEDGYEQTGESALPWYSDSPDPNESDFVEEVFGSPTTEDAAVVRFREPVAEVAPVASKNPALPGASEHAGSSDAADEFPPPSSQPESAVSASESSNGTAAEIMYVDERREPFFVELDGCVPSPPPLRTQKSSASVSAVAVDMTPVKGLSFESRQFSTISPANSSLQDIYRSVIQREVVRNAPGAVDVEYVDPVEAENLRLHSFVRKSKQSGKANRRRKLWVELERSLAPFFEFFSPLERGVREIEGMFGNGVGCLFNFSRFIIHLNLFVGILWLALTIIPWSISPPAAWLEETSVTDYLGFFGVDGLEYTWVYYGGYTPFAGSYNMAVAYSCAILVAFIAIFFVIIFALRAQIMRDQAAESLIRHDRQFLFASIIFGAWDWKLESRPAAQQLKSGLINVLRERMEEIRVKQFLSEKKSCCARLGLFMRRAIGISMFILVFLVCTGVIFFIAINQSSLNASFPYTVSIIVTLINFLVPPIVHQIVAFEAWVNTKIVVRNNVGRVYFLKMVNIVVLVVAVQNLDRLTGGSECVETSAGQMFWQLLIVDFVLSVANVVIFGPFQRCITGKPVDIDFSSSVNELIYRQGILWIGMCVCPMMAFLGSLTNVVLFYLRKWVTVKTCKAPERPWAVSSMTSFFLWFLLLTLLIAGLPTLWFLQRASSTVCGPHVDNETPWDAVLQQLSYAPSVVQDGVSFLASPLLLGPAVLILVIALYFKSASLTRLQHRFDTAVQEMDTERSDKIALLRQFNIRL